MQTLSLFSGSGLLDHALRLGHTVRGYCEIDPFARKVLAARIEDGLLQAAPIHTDVRDVRGVPGCAIVAGFPCQDTSRAGKNAGLAGARSGLFHEVMRIARESDSPFLFLENVKGLYTNGLHEVLATLWANGYVARWGLFHAYEVGAPHHRPRWFCIAHKRTRPMAALHLPTVLPYHGRTTQQGEVERWDRETMRPPVSMWATPKARDWRSGCTSQDAIDRLMARRVPLSNDLPQQVTMHEPVRETGLLNPAWLEALMGWPAGWSDPNVRVSPGDSWGAWPAGLGQQQKDWEPMRLMTSRGAYLTRGIRKQRTALLGNGVVPAQVEFAFRKIFLEIAVEKD